MMYFQLNIYEFPPQNVTIGQSKDATGFSILDTVGISTETDLNLEDARLVIQGHIKAGYEVTQYT